MLRILSGQSILPIYKKTAESPPAPNGPTSLISPENIPRINLIHHIIQTRIIPVRNNRLRHRLDPLHHALNRTLPEIIRIALHRQPVDTHNNRPLLRHIILCTLHHWQALTYHSLHRPTTNPYCYAGYRGNFLIDFFYNCIVHFRYYINLQSFKIFLIASHTAKDGFSL